MVRDYGDCALMIQCDSTSEVLAWADTLTRARLPGVLDIVAASRTVLLKLAGPGHQEPVRRYLLTTDPGSGACGPHSQAGQPDVVLDVIYDGVDLTEVADLTGLDPAGVVAAHTAAPWRVGFSGFAPGFAYLVGGDPRLRVPRRAEPRTRVPAGAVALAGEFSGVYPRVSPGGWQLIGHTDAVLWDVDRPRPALLTPGTWVQFRACDGSSP